MRQVQLLSTALFFAITLTACGNMPYRIDVDQGNLIDQKALDGLSIGMSKDDVQRTLGTSLLMDMFHSDRWDYVQYYQQGNTQSVQKSRVSLYFTNGLLSRIAADKRKKIETKPVPYSVK